MRITLTRTRPRAALLLVLLLVSVPAVSARKKVQPAPERGGAGPIGTPLPPAYTPERLRAAHLLRRASFGPTRSDIRLVAQIGETAWIDWQLQPALIDDSFCESQLPTFMPDENYAAELSREWYTRMVYSRRQLLERMTLFWHEHFATSASKVFMGRFMRNQEYLFRRNALGSFRQMIIDVSKDNAMLMWLDNDPNSGTALDENGDPIPPNENYARELMQVFTIGSVRLNMNGSVVRDGQGNPLPNYTETDVRALARALTGWNVDWENEGPGYFYPDEHDATNKVVMGTTIVGRPGAEGALELDAVADMLMAHPSMPPFIAKEMIQKFATETPTPGYIQRVATVFQQSNGDVAATLRAVLTDTEFYSAAVMRTQYRTPIEQFVHVVRALDGTTQGNSFVDWTEAAHHQLYYPPSVFSFYRPGLKRSLVNTALAITRDSVADELTNGWTDPDGYRDTAFDADALIQRYWLTTPELCVDYLIDALIAAPVRKSTRGIALDSMEGQVNATKFRGAAWLIICSPEFQQG